MKCGFTWKAPFILAPGAPKEIVAGRVRVPVKGDRIFIQQECIENIGHVGKGKPHRSATNVIYEDG